MNHARNFLEILDGDEVLAAISPDEEHTLERCEALVEYRSLDLAAKYVREHDLTIDAVQLLAAARCLADMIATDPPPF